MDKHTKFNEAKDYSKYNIPEDNNNKKMVENTDDNVTKNVWVDWPIKRRMSNPYEEHIDKDGNWIVDDRVLEDYYIMPWEEPGYMDEPPSQEVIDAHAKEQEEFDKKWDEIERIANNRFAVLDDIRARGNLEPLKNNHDGGNRPKKNRRYH